MEKERIALELVVGTEEARALEAFLDARDAHYATGSRLLGGERLLFLRETEGGRSVVVQELLVPDAKAFQGGITGALSEHTVLWSAEESDPKDLVSRLAVLDKPERYSLVELAVWEGSAWDRWLPDLIDRALCTHSMPKPLTP